jgi:signal transduction histidine kinase
LEADLPVGAGERIELVRGIMLVSASNDNIIATMDILNHQAVILMSIVGVLIFVVTLLVSKFLFAPFKKIIAALDQVQEGYTNDPISVTDCLETEHIGDAFNRVLGRMKMLDDSRQEFVSNVSHELRTPITSMKVLADSLITQKDVPLAVYQEFMIDIAAEIEREDKIINDLLSLVKMDRTSADLNISEVDINALVELIMRRLRPIAQRRDVQLVYESLRPVTASVDEVKLTLALSNLVENAIKYNKEHGFVKVTLDADHQFFTVKVEDSGVGIPQDALEHIYERFYRVDKSRSREIGGTGLGLAITKSAILMHRGSIKVTSIEGEGTDFTVKIPLKYIAV